MQDNDKQKERIQVARWLAEFPEIIGTILNRGGDISLGECIEIIEVLEKQNVEYLVPIFIYIIRMYYVVDEAIDRIMQENTVGSWLDNETKDFYKDLKEMLKKEMNK